MAKDWARRHFDAVNHFAEPADMHVKLPVRALRGGAARPGKLLSWVGPDNQRRASSMIATSRASKIGWSEFVKARTSQNFCCLKRRGGAIIEPSEKRS